MILLYPVSPKDNRETVRWFTRRFQELRIFRTILSDRRRSRIWFLGVRQKKSRMMQIEGRASVDDQHEEIASSRWRCFPLSILKWKIRRSIVVFPFTLERTYLNFIPSIFLVYRHSNFHNYSPSSLTVSDFIRYCYLYLSIVHPDMKTSNDHNWKSSDHSRQCSHPQSEKYWQSVEQPKLVDATRSFIDFDLRRKLLS